MTTPTTADQAWQDELAAVLRAFHTAPRPIPDELERRARAVLDGEPLLISRPSLVRVMAVRELLADNAEALKRP